MKTLAITSGLTTEKLLRRFRQSPSASLIINLLFASGIGVWMFNLVALIHLY